MLRLLKQMKARQWIMALLCVALILGQIYFDLRLPDYMSDLTVQIKTPGSTVSDVLHTGLEMLACTLISAVMAILCGYLNAQVAAGFSYHIRESVFQKVADFGQKEMLEFSVPSLINRTTNDITQIQMFVAMGMQTMIKAPVMAVWAVIKIVNKSWTLSVITAGFVVALLALMLIVVLVILPRVRRVQKLTDNINLISRENLTGISVVHAYNAEEYQEDKFEKANDVLMRTQLFNQRAMALLMPAVGLAMNALSLTIYWVGAAIVNRVSATDLAGRISTPAERVAEERTEETAPELPLDTAALEWRYPYEPETTLSAKLTATQLKGRALDEEIAENAPLPPRLRSLAKPRFLEGAASLTPAEQGTAMHAALQFLDFSTPAEEGAVRAAVKSMEERRLLTPEQARAVDAAALTRFLQSPLCARIRAAGERVRREYRFSLLESAARFVPEASAGDEILLQGVVDCFFKEDGALVVVDFKTDHVAPDALAERAEHYRPQLEAYSLALAQVIGRPVKEKILYFLRRGEQIIL